MRNSSPGKAELQARGCYWHPTSAREGGQPLRRNDSGPIQTGSPARSRGQRAERSCSLQSVLQSRLLPSGCSSERPRIGRLGTLSPKEKGAQRRLRMDSSRLRKEEARSRPVLAWRHAVESRRLRSRDLQCALGQGAVGFHSLWPSDRRAGVEALHAQMKVLEAAPAVWDAPAQAFGVLSRAGTAIPQPMAVPVWNWCCR